MNITDVVGLRIALTERDGYALGKCSFCTAAKKTLVVIPGLDHFSCFSCGREGNADDYLIMLKKYERIPTPGIQQSWRGTVYVLQLADGCIYVGFTTCLERRWHKHVSGKGAYWTKSHPPLGILETFDNVPFAMENEVTERYIRRYGWEKVRGGDYCGLLKYYADPGSLLPPGPSGAYLLKLTGGYYYVGFANDIDQDIRLQFSGNGCRWTQLHPPVKEIRRLATDRESIQRKLTLDTMARYGWQRVRGYIWSAPTIQRPTCLPPATKAADQLLIGNYYLS